jgi:hypothetical protein
MLDLLGNVSLSLQVAILFLLILGLPLERGLIGKKNLIKHGYLTTVALALHTILIFVVMVPSFADGLGDLGSLSFLASLDVWSHVVLGSVAEVMGLIIIVVWLSKPPSMMRCAKLKKWMLPLFVIWVISLVNGSLVHILQLIG